MSVDKYPSIISGDMETVFTILSIFVVTSAVLKIGKFSRLIPRIFSHVTRLEQSRASENIKWIISNYQ